MFNQYYDLRDDLHQEYCIILGVREGLLSRRRRQTAVDDRVRANEPVSSYNIIMAHHGTIRHHIILYYRPHTPVWYSRLSL